MNPEELQNRAQKRRDEDAQYEHQIRVCTAAGCASQQSDELLKDIKKQVGATAHKSKCGVKGVGCMGLCSAGPLVSVQKKDESEVLYGNVKVEDADDVVGSLDSGPIARLRCDETQPFFQRQVRVVLENSGQIDPEDINDYIAAGGYSALSQALAEMTPEGVLSEVTASGLRGRGGGGYPAGLKWSTVAKSDDPTKYVICNADEGDPGAFMDRAVLESDPHRVLEGIALAAYATGASHGYIYVRAEYPLAISRLKKAINQATRAGMLGNDIAGTHFSFKIDIRLGAGAFVCGEETALIASIEGHRGQPRPRPPYPAESGLWGHPTLINNVETFANVAPIVRNGGAWYAGMGTDTSKGTKVFALAGKIRNTGLIEVPMGISLREIVFEIGGGIPDDKAFKAVQTGGPSGGCLPEDKLDMSVDYDTLREAGSIMGSGGMIIMDESSSMVDVARYFMEFCMSESCGKCVPCRVGTYQMHQLLDRIYKQTATMDDLELLEDLCEVVQQTSLCGLGQTAPNPVLSTLRYFRQEYLDRIAQKRIPAGLAVS